MFITPSKPSLDPAEKLIVAIKDKLKIRQFHGHELSLDSLRDVVEQLVHNNFEKLINKSLGESINKMKSYLLLHKIIEELAHIIKILFPLLTLLDAQKC